MAVTTESRVCGHCQQTTRGHAVATNGAPLCHATGEPDCYHLVTVYNHPMPCPCA